MKTDDATAKLLAGKGAKVVLGAPRSDKLKRIADEIARDGGHAVYQELDVTKRSDNDALVGLAKNAFGRVSRPLRRWSQGLSRRCSLWRDKMAVRDFMEVRRRESAMEGTNIRTATIYPAAINTELLSTISDKGTAQSMQGIYDNYGISPDRIVDVVAFVIDAPQDTTAARNGYPRKVAFTSSRASGSPPPSMLPTNLSKRNFSMPT